MSTGNTLGGTTGNSTETDGIGKGTGIGSETNTGRKEEAGDDTRKEEKKSANI